MAQISWEFSESEINNVRKIVNRQEHNPFVQERRERNVVAAEIKITADQFWNAHLAALLTSQQRSGPESHVSQFLKEEIHSVSLDKCRNTDRIHEYVAEILKEYGGIRYYNNIGEACERNLERLDAGGWDELWDEFEKLVEMRKQEPRDSDYVVEREVATYLSEGFAGDGFHRVGSKQARNILQILGLTRFEIPLDSRITKWLNSNLELPYRVSGSGLSNREYYHFISDIVQDSCSTADVLPCIFDAAVFSSYDMNRTQNNADAIF
ncbi:hypothetical protein [Haloferax marisrubri]|uniref:Uncharacterized protein n=1 Tax=Haloferax marisrubri TaxID=1544719 RepID=A0A2P4NPM9_9EURY|nr:hypothetical protein [Haloferax marisrubri]POG55097.1 hypothetical protein AUR65_011760 [Haloferax marisrubri]